MCTPWICKQFLKKYFTFYYSQEGTIGHDLVLKPVPAHVRQHLDNSRDKNEDDDEMFLDDEAMEDEAVPGGFPLAPQHKHIVYRRSVQETDQFSDYGGLFCSCILLLLNYKTLL